MTTERSRDGLHAAGVAAETGVGLRLLALGGRINKRQVLGRPAATRSRLRRPAGPPPVESRRAADQRGNEATANGLRGMPCARS